MPQQRADTSFAVTVAGTGQEGYFGDGGPGTNARMSFPEGAALDAAGNLYIADSGNHRIRKLSPAGVLTTVVGTGFEGFSGDGGPALQAQISHPEGVALDGTGSLYIADFGNGRIRKVSPEGTISTIAGGKRGFFGDGGPALNAAFHDLISVAADPAGNLYLADTENFRVRKITPDGIVTTFAGNGVAGFGGDGGPAASAMLDRPTDLVVDATGNLFIADSGNNRIRKVDPNGVITTVAGSGDPTTFVGGFSGDRGPAIEATFSTPTDIAVDTAGNLFIADTYNNRIRKIAPDGTIITVVGSGIAGYSGDRGLAAAIALNEPIGVEINASGNLYIADNANHRILKVVGIAAPGLIAGKPFPLPAPGDVNRDGKINVQDAVLVLRFTVKLETLAADQLKAADLSGDEKVDVRDAIAILRKAVNIEP